MKQVLVPHSIAKECFLIEALYWVAFKTYPLYYQSIKGEYDIRRNFCYHENDDAEFIYGDLEYFFTEQNCTRYGLPVNPRSKYWESDVEEPMSLKTIDFILKNDDVDKKTSAKMLKDKDIAMKYNAEIEDWEECLADYLGPSKAQIFLALKNGKLKTSGRKIGNLKKGVPNALWENKDNWDELEDWENVQRSNIPKEFWRMEGIDWYDGSARSPKGLYTNIILDVDELLTIFLEPQPEAVSICSINGTLLLDDKEQAKG